MGPVVEEQSTMMVQEATVHPLQEFVMNQDSLRVVETEEGEFVSVLAG